MKSAAEMNRMNGGRWRPKLASGRAAGSAAGVELVEFALVLPLLLLLIAGVWDFGSAFLLKDKMTNAAREGARIAVSTPLNSADCSSSTPCSIVAAANAVRQYMSGAGNDAGCIVPEQPASFAAPDRANYLCESGIALEIDRGAVIETETGSIPATRVTLTFPVRWMLIGRLLSSVLPQTISTTVTMQNLT